MTAIDYEALREERPELYFPAWRDLSRYWHAWLDVKTREEVIGHRVARLLGREVVPGHDDVAGKPEPLFNLT